MAFTVENGSGIPGATSYLTLVEFQSFAADRLVQLGADELVQSQLVKAADWLESMADLYIGLPTYPPREATEEEVAFAGQGLAWPRTVTNCETGALIDFGVPDRVKKAQAFAALAIVAGVELMPTEVTTGIKREKVDVLEVEYFGGANVAPRVAPAIEQIKPLLRTYMRPGRGLTVRV